MTTYLDFLARKTSTVTGIGPEIDGSDVNPFLHEWQRELVTWAVRTGRAALWADTGLGKTLMQLEWARLSGERVLILAPLAVCQQTVREGRKIDVDVRYAREDDGRPGITITNYEISERGETVLTPFAGIGSEVYVAHKLGRVGIGCELKPSYWRTAVANLRALDAEGDQHSFLADLTEAS